MLPVDARHAVGACSPCCGWMLAMLSVDEKGIVNASVFLLPPQTKTHVVPFPYNLKVQGPCKHLSHSPLHELRLCGPVNHVNISVITAHITIRHKTLHREKHAYFLERMAGESISISSASTSWVEPYPSSSVYTWTSSSPEVARELQRV